jgi:uncharacterized membrane protein YbhN (UPF0104 family)
MAAVIVICRHFLFQSLRLLAHLNVMWLAVALVLQVVSLTAFSLIRRRLLHASGHRVGMGAVTAITCAANAISASVPIAGTSLSVVYDFRQFRRRGVDPAAIGWALAMSGILCTSALALVLLAGALVAGTAGGAAGGLIGAAVYLVPAAAVLLARRHDRALKAMSRVVTRLAHGLQRLLRRPAASTGSLAEFPVKLESLIHRIASIRLPARRYGEMFALAVLNPMAQCGVLAASILATGQPVPWHVLFLACGAGAAAGSTGLTPGGFGIVEMALAATLATAGLTGPGALAAALTYRLVGFWLVLIAGWIILLALSLRRNHAGKPATLRRCQLDGGRRIEGAGQRNTAAGDAHASAGGQRPLVGFWPA